MSTQFLPDGGTAVWQKRLTLPKMLMFTAESMLILPWDDENAYIGFEFNGHMFALVVNVTAQELQDYAELNGFAKFEWQRVGRVEVSRTTGECFRPVLATMLK